MRKAMAMPEAVVEKPKADPAPVWADGETLSESFIRKRTGKKVTIVMPAYNAAKTLAATYRDIPEGSFDEVILVDDASQDETVRLSEELCLVTVAHPENRGYGANQKTCYQTALERGADIVVMLHPDYQYDPRIVPNLALPIAEGQADAVLASRFLHDPIEGGPLRGGMPFWKFVSNRFLTKVENLALGTHFSEFHTGYRAYSRKALESIPFERNSDDFVFDNEIIVQMVKKGISFKEVPVIARYFPEASSVGFLTSLRYGMQVLGVVAKARRHESGRKPCPLFMD
jgi:glycosyltransferase involved in cell wall biosynthesis